MYVCVYVFKEYLPWLLATHIRCHQDPLKRAPSECIRFQT